MTHKQMADTVKFWVENDFEQLSNLCSRKHPYFVAGIRSQDESRRLYIYLLYNEWEFLTASPSIKAHELNGKHLDRAIRLIKIDPFQSSDFYSKMHIRMVVPDTPDCRLKLKRLSKRTADWPRYCLLLDSQGEYLRSDLPTLRPLHPLVDDTPVRQKNRIKLRYKS